MLTRRSGCGVAIMACLLALSPRANAEKRTIRWVLAHDPSVAAEQSARDFAARIEKETNGNLRVDVIKSVPYNTLNGKIVSSRALINHLADGKIEMTQIYTTSLARFNPKLPTLSNPYLFRDYEHAEAVFEGALGAEIIASVPARSGVRGLGITYSGGYGIFGMTAREVRAPQDMQGLKLQTDRFPWLWGYVGALGIEPISAPPEAFIALGQAGFADAVETTVARFDEYGDDRVAKIIVNTDHFLLTTMIVINEKFMQSLPADEQEKVQRLAVECAREERALSIKANVDGRANLEKRGVKFIDLTAAQKKAFADALQPVYQTAWSLLGADWAAAIRATKTTRTASR